MPEFDDVPEAESQVAKPLHDTDIVAEFSLGGLIETMYHIPAYTGAFWMLFCFLSSYGL